MIEVHVRWGVIVGLVSRKLQSTFVCLCVSHHIVFPIMSFECKVCFGSTIDTDMDRPTLSMKHISSFALSAHPTTYSQVLQFTSQTIVTRERHLAYFTMAPPDLAMHFQSLGDMCIFIRIDLFSGTPLTLV